MITIYLGASRRQWSRENGVLSHGIGRKVSAGLRSSRLRRTVSSAFGEPEIQSQKHQGDVPKRRGLDGKVEIYYPEHLRGRLGVSFGDTTVTREIYSLGLLVCSHS